MKTSIILIEQILPAHDWFFEGEVVPDAPASEHEAVVCFAVVSAVSVDHLSLPPSKYIVPLGVENYGDMDLLMGSSVSDLQRSIVHRTVIDAATAERAAFE